MTTPRILPHLNYDDPGAAIEWLTRVFGFRERVAARHTSPESVSGRALPARTSCSTSPIVRVALDVCAPD